MTPRSEWARLGQNRLWSPEQVLIQIDLLTPAHCRIRKVAELIKNSAIPPDDCSDQPTRDQVIGRIADHLTAQDPGHPLRVAVDGITAAGKTTLARALASAVAGRGRPAIHLSMDGFHHPRAHRHRQGRDSAAGYYEDAYDFPTFARTVLIPMGPGGDRRYLGRIIDLASDRRIDEPPVTAPAEAVLIVDGSFLQHSELAHLWDEVVFADTSFLVARRRGTTRDAALFGGLEQAEKAFDNRYHAACRQYLTEVDPATRASIVIGNDDIDHPELRRIGDLSRPQ
ncbi:hypothetical protein OG381_46455 [Streptomyces sp. NBC_00490]|uniref:hypothetical protein n=1 Tax=Streptomyces sp. NBC_00490 TaxID=2903657 RepID=UPI002E19EE54